MARTLIVNADDCYLTPGVTQAILDCHDRGIVTSTTFMINLSADRQSLREILKRKKLGVGLHLNVTFGKPVSKVNRIKSLLSPKGNFRRPFELYAKPPLAKELLIEYQNQIELFCRLFKRRPTHLDTHHQLHDHPFFLECLMKLAIRYRLPIRRSSLMASHEVKNFNKIQTPEFLFGDLNPFGFWRKDALEILLRNLPEGVSEIMCHPGKVDQALKKVSSMTLPRQAEYKLFRSPVLKRLIEKAGIVLSHYGICYT